MEAELMVEGVKVVDAPPPDGGPGGRPLQIEVEIKQMNVQK